MNGHYISFVNKKYSKIHHVEENEKKKKKNRMKIAEIHSGFNYYFNMFILWRIHTFILVN